MVLSLILTFMLKEKDVCVFLWVLTYELVIHETAFKKMFENYLCLSQFLSFFTILFLYRVRSPSFSLGQFAAMAHGCAEEVMRSSTSTYVRQFPMLLYLNFIFVYFLFYLCCQSQFHRIFFRSIVGHTFYVFALQNVFALDFNFVYEVEPFASNLHSKHYDEVVHFPPYMCDSFFCFHLPSLDAALQPHFSRQPITNT